MKVQRREAVDVLTRDGETAILFSETAVRLSALGAAIFTLTKAPTGLDELASELRKAFGEPGDTTLHEATFEAVADLVCNGVLRYV